jgi:myosin-18
MKARQNAEMELTDTQTQYEELSRNKQDLEDKYLRMSREKADLSSQLQENEEEMQDVMRKYKASVAAVSTDQITIQDQQTSIQELEDERNKLRDSVAELSSKLGNLEGENVSTAQHKRLELKVRELESKLDLEATSKTRLETQIARLKEQIEKLVRDNDDLRLKEQNSADAQRKISRQLRDVKEEFSSLQVKETELSQKKFDLEKQLEVSESETLTVKSDLKLAQKRIEDLSAALAGDVDSADSEDNSDSSDEEMASFLEHHRRAMSVQRERESMARESVIRDSILRESVGRDSIARESIAREIRAGSTAAGRTYASIDESRESITVDTSANSSTIKEVDESQA